MGQLIWSESWKHLTRRLAIHFKHTIIKTTTQPELMPISFAVTQAPLVTALKMSAACAGFEALSAWFTHTHAPVMCISTLLPLRVRLKASLWMYWSRPADIRWSSLGYQERKGHCRPSGPVWDTWLIHQWIIRHGSATEKEKIYWPKLVDGLVSGVMYGRYGIRVGRVKKSIQSSIKGP